MKRKNRKYTIREEMTWLKGKAPQKKEYNVIHAHACPHCGEVRSIRITYLRRGFMQCETCKEYFITRENLMRHNAKKENTED